MPRGLCGKSECGDFYNKRAVTDRRREKTGGQPAERACPRVFSEIKQKLSSLLRDFARRLKQITRASKTAHSDNKVIAQHCQFCMNARKRSLRKIDCVRCVSAPIFAKTFAFAGKVSRAILILCVRRNIAPQRKTPIAPSKARTMGLS